MTTVSADRTKGRAARVEMAPEMGFRTAKELRIYL
ncbi:protein of unknown function [Hyphomicrobium sp. 1Nfss2.1]